MEMRFLLKHITLVDKNYKNMTRKYNGKRITFRVDEKTRTKGEKVAKKKGTTISDLARTGFEKQLN